MPAEGICKLHLQGKLAEGLLEHRMVVRLAAMVIEALKYLNLPKPCQCHTNICGCLGQDDRFRLQKKSYDNQYAQLYYCRLQRMQPGLRKRVEREWPGVRG